MNPSTHTVQKTPLLLSASATAPHSPSVKSKRNLSTLSQVLTKPSINTPSPRTSNTPLPSSNNPFPSFKSAMMRRDPFQLTKHQPLKCSVLSLSAPAASPAPLPPSSVMSKHVFETIPMPPPSPASFRPLNNPPLTPLKTLIRSRRSNPHDHKKRNAHSLRFWCTNGHGRNMMPFSIVTGRHSKTISVCTSSSSSTSLAVLGIVPSSSLLSS
mmetsp:Transcript_25160/g.30397  ORF Transcript_25160/g.30397 Transcript_25160/m.30397 type:complete len:212 (-) Transcript_25160:1452-2087(-)